MNNIKILSLIGITFISNSIYAQNISNDEIKKEILNNINIRESILKEQKNCILKATEKKEIISCVKKSHEKEKERMQEFRDSMKQKRQQ